MAARCALIVDGIPVMARMLVEALGEAGWDAAVATREGEAIAALESGHFNAVVSAVDIPEGNGFDLLMRVRSRPGPAPPVILMGSFASPETSRMAEEAGAFGYLPKPFELGALVQLLESACSEVAPEHARS